MEFQGEQEVTTPNTIPALQKILFPLITLLCLTLVTQLGSLAYTFEGDFLSVLGPSALVLCAVTIPFATLGLILGQQIGLGAPLLTDLLNRRAGWRQQLLLDARLATVMGVAVGALLLLLRFAVASYLPPELPAFGHRGAWGGLLVSISAAIGEEVWLRLGVLTILAWTFMRLSSRQEIGPVVGWSAIVFSSLAFAGMHLPQLASYGAATPIGVLGTMTGNTLVGVLFGWLYWRRSLIAAMIAHFAVDVVLHMLTAFGN